MIARDLDTCQLEKQSENKCIKKQAYLLESQPCVMLCFAIHGIQLALFHGYVRDKHEFLAFCEATE